MFLRDEWAYTSYNFTKNLHLLEILYSYLINCHIVTLGTYIEETKNI